MPIEKTKIEEAVKLFLEAIGENLTREGLVETPKRVANMIEELFEKARKIDEASLFRSFSSGFNGLVIVKNISFCSFCEHHLMPFFGNVHVAYLPGSKIIGLSKLARIVDFCSGCLQVQENLTKLIADSILEKTDARGVMVVVDGFHSCMALRGVKKLDSRTITFEANGVCKNDWNYKSEFFRLLG